ncbi:MAG: hypothetical protein EXQ87_11090 [Alphaproteobacteria bacterium]|nr:hypothetical protein [Alphaproteobacteria bacterium]
MVAHFIVRAEVRDAADRPEFDRWYRSEHLPDAVKAFKVKRAWRGWSQVDPALHVAVYEFDSLATAQAVTGTDTIIRPLIAEFDRVWGVRVTRARDLVDIAQTIAG